MLKLVCGNAHPALSEKIGAQLELALEPAEIGAFGDGESRVELNCNVRGSSVAVLQPTCPPVNDHLVTLGLLLDAVRAAGARQVIAVLPYFGYARQEQRSSVGEPRSAQFVTRVLEAAGADHVIVFDLHEPALESALHTPLTHISSVPVLSSLLSTWRTEPCTIVSPDAGGMKRAQAHADALEAELAVCVKRRPQKDAAQTTAVLGEVHRRHCIIVDDLVSSGRTLAGAARSLRDRGAARVDAVFSHAVLAGDAQQRLQEAPLDRIATTDSVPRPAGFHPEIVSVAPAIAEALHGVVSEATA